ncbi:MAG: hypothetical protein MJ233_00750 [Mycoplasmoidaceae bacterium]|nr:hypothetical protein [Mycoplasmoidaceae bacterium]
MKQIIIGILRLPYLVLKPSVNAANGTSINPSKHFATVHKIENSSGNIRQIPLIV